MTPPASSSSCLNEAARRLEQSGVTPTPRRCLVMERLLASRRSMTPPELLEELNESGEINKVTLYRILDLLVERGLAQRTSAGERAFRYCLRDHHGRGHGHFQCRRCGAISCLTPEESPLDPARLAALPLCVEEIELRLIGLCPACQKLEANAED